MTGVDAQLGLKPLECCLDAANPRTVIAPWLWWFTIGVGWAEGVIKAVGLASPLRPLVQLLPHVAEPLKHLFGGIALEIVQAYTPLPAPNVYLQTWPGGSGSWLANSQQVQGTKESGGIGLFSLNQRF